MISDIMEYSNETAIKESQHPHPTLKQVQKQMRGFDEAIIMYVYHKMNGRFDEAQSYLQEWDEEQEELHCTFMKKNELNSQPTITDGDSNQQHATPDTANDAKEQGVHTTA
jgi:hypothetical protein